MAGSARLQPGGSEIVMFEFGIFFVVFFVAAFAGFEKGLAD